MLPEKVVASDQLFRPKKQKKMKTTRRRIDRKVDGQEITCESVSDRWEFPSFEVALQPDRVDVRALPISLSRLPRDAVVVVVARFHNVFGWRRDVWMEKNGWGLSWRFDVGREDVFPVDRRTQTIVHRGRSASPR